MTGDSIKSNTASLTPIPPGTPGVMKPMNQETIPADTIKRLFGPAAAPEPSNMSSVVP